MPDKLPSRPAPNRASAASHLPDDRATLPAPVEAATPSAWQEFDLLREQHDAAFADTLPTALTRLDAQRADNDSRMSSAPVPPGAPAATMPPAPQRPLTLDDVVALCRKDNRCCPVPSRWAALYALLPGTAQAPDGSWTPAAPVSAREWAATSGMHKRLLLREQLEWAAAHGALQQAAAFLARLSPQEWTYLR